MCPRYQECWNKCSSIIAAHLGGGFDGSGLAPIYKTLFGANNDLYALGGARENEIIWITPQDGTYLTSYGGSTFMIAAGTKEGVNNSLNLRAAWASMRARKEFAELFSWTESGDALVSADQAHRTVECRRQLQAGQYRGGRVYRRIFQQ